MIIFYFKKEISRIILICLSINFLLGIEYVNAAESKKEPVLYARACSVMDGTNGRVLYEKEGDKELSNASTTKIITCILVLENCNIEEYVTVSNEAAKQPNVKLGIKKGEKYKIKDLLYAMMLESYNDCAYALAEFVSGDIDKFSELMNEKLSQIGCEHTYFITPNGLDAQISGKSHHSSANDLCRIMKYCVWDSAKSEEFQKITQTKNYSFIAENNRNVTVTNHNRLLLENENIISGKTGFTAKAGYCYVGAYEKDGIKYCFSLLACGWPNNKNYKWVDSRKIMEYIQDFFEIYKSDFRFDKSITAKDYYTGSPSLSKWNNNNKVSYKIISENKNCLVKKDTKITYKINQSEFTNDVYKRNETIGKIEYYCMKKLIFSQKISLKNDLYKWKLEDLLFAVFKEYVSI